MDDGKVVQLSLREFVDALLLAVPQEFGLVDTRFPPGGSKMAALTEALADMVEHYVVRGGANGRVEHPEVELAHELVSSDLHGSGYGFMVAG